VAPRAPGFLPQYAPIVRQVALPLESAELPIIFWLAIWGAKTRRVEAVGV
jgi:hypothetical protein